MILKNYEIKGYDYVELVEDFNKSGKSLFKVQTQRIFRNKVIRRNETFNTKKEAEKWLEYI